jgi:hypothetical protein
LWRRIHVSLCGYGDPTHARANNWVVESMAEKQVRPPAEFKPPKWEAKGNLPAEAALEPVRAAPAMLD